MRIAPNDPDVATSATARGVRVRMRERNLSYSDAVADMNRAAEAIQRATRRDGLIGDEGRR